MRIFKPCVLAVAIVATAVAGLDALAQDFPNKPIRIIVPHVAGGVCDITTPIVQGKAMELLGQSLLVDSRAGGYTPDHAGRWYQMMPPEQLQRIYSKCWT